MAYEPIDPTEVAAKQPLDTLLMGKVQVDTADSNTRLTNLENRVNFSSIANVLEIFNGNFGIDSTGILGGTAAGAPAGWALALQTNGAGAIDQTYDIDGANGFKFSCIGGGSNGGGTLTTTAFYPVNKTATPILALIFYTIGSASGMYGSLVANFYDKTFTLISSSTIWSRSGSYPTTLQKGTAFIDASGVSGAAYITLTLGGALVGSPSGSVWFGGLRGSLLDFGKQFNITSQGSGGQTGTYTTGYNTGIVYVKLIGRNNGGNGGKVEGLAFVSPNTGYSFSISSNGTVQLMGMTAQSDTDGGGASGGAVNVNNSQESYGPSIIFAYDL